MNVISYFNLIPDSKFSSESEGIIDLWSKSWSKHGWSPVVLNENHAKQNELYSQLDLNNPGANFYKTVKNRPMWRYHRSCYCRLLAYCDHVKRNGMVLYADYDVINYGFTPDMLTDIQPDTVLCSARSTVYLSEHGAADMENAMINFNNNTFNEVDENGSCNDMRIMGKYTNVFKSDHGTYVSNISPDFSNSTPLVHFDGGCYKRGMSRDLSRVEIIDRYDKSR